MRCYIVATWETPWWRMFAHSPESNCGASGWEKTAMLLVLKWAVVCESTSTVERHHSRVSPPPTEAPSLSAAMRLAAAKQSWDKSSCREQTSSRFPWRALSQVRTCLLPVATSEWQPVSQCDLTHFVPGNSQPRLTVSGALKRQFYGSGPSDDFLCTFTNAS